MIIGWFLKAEKMRSHINKAATVKIGKWWDFSVKILIPVVLIVILVSGLFQEFSAPYGGYPVVWLILIGRDWILATIIASIMITRYEWKKLEN